MKKNTILTIVCLQVLTGLAWGQRALSVSPASVFPGDTIAIDVNLNDGSGVGGLQFNLNYNSTVLSLFDTDGDGSLSDEVQKGTLLTSQHTLTSNPTTPGLVSIIAVGVTSMNAGPGSVVRLTFQISESAAPGITGLVLSDIVASDPTGVSLPVGGNNGSVTVNEIPNQFPNALNDSATTNEDEAVIIAVLANDNDPDGDTLTVSGVTHGTLGTVTIQNSSSVLYTPFENHHSSDSFTYTISDGRGGTDQAGVTITINPVNDPPQAINDEADTTEGQPVTVSVLANDTDVDGDTLSVTGVTQGSHGSVTVNGQTSVTYVPSGDFSGQDSFTYTISDGNGETDVASVMVSVTGVNDPPQAMNDSATTDEDVAATVWVLSNDTDPDGDELVISAVTQSQNGWVSIAEAGQAVRYIPNDNFNGIDSFSYTVSDGQGGSGQATVGITINGVNDPPDARDDQATTLQREATVLNILLNDVDVDEDALSVTNLSQPGHGTAVLNSDQSVTYTPNSDFFGEDSFTYTV
ncbi:MAG: tandem-95 repeat protein, partial [Acidobacteriota bacterium]